MTAVVKLKSGFEIAVPNLKEIIVSHGDKETKYTNFNDFSYQVLQLASDSLVISLYPH